MDAPIEPMDLDEAEDILGGGGADPEVEPLPLEEARRIVEEG